MGEHVAIDGHPTWIDERGSGEPIVLLHGGFSNTDDTFAGFAPLTEHYRAIAFDRRGHGRTADTEAPFHYDDMATETIAVLELLLDRAAPLIGYSDGAIVALHVALRRPELVTSLVLVGANYRADGLVPGVFDGLAPDREPPEMLVHAYAERSPDGREHFAVVARKAIHLFNTEPNLTTEQLRTISCPALVLAGDDDAMTLAHTCSLYEALPAGQLAIVPGTSHLLVYEKGPLMNQLILEFLQSDGQPATFMPVRRAH